jgi:Zn-dependent protease
MEPFIQRDAEPARRRDHWRSALRKRVAPVAVLGSVAVKLLTVAKFAAVFVAFGGYALLWGWKFALGLIVLILMHEMGHFVEAAREHLHPQWPVFLPFLGAYVRHTRGNPWQTARVALAGPILGGLGALGFYVAGRVEGSNLLVALGYFGFFLNLLNLLPIGILDGGAIWRSTRWLWIGGARTKALISGTLFAATASSLLVGAVAAYVPQHRL